MRKQVTLILIASFCCIVSNAQTDKGRFFLSGNTNLSALISKTKHKGGATGGETDSHSFAVTPGVGYFIIDNVALGISASFQYNYLRTPSFIDDNPAGSAVYYEDNISTTLAVIPSLSYYFPVKGNLKPSITVGAGFASLKERGSNSSNENNVLYHYTGLSLNGAAGVSYFINKHVSFDLMAQYTHNNLKDIDNTALQQKVSGIAAIAGISVFF